MSLRFLMHNYFLKSLSFRITSIFALFSLITLFSLGLTVHSFLNYHFTQQDQNILLGKVKLIENLLEQNKNSNQDLLLFLNNSLIGHANLKVHIQNTFGENLYTNFPKELTIEHDRITQTQQWLHWKVNGISYMGLQTYYSPTSTLLKNQEPITIIVAIDNSEHTLFIQQFRSQLLLIGLIGILCLMIFGWYAVYRGLQPIIRMKLVAQNISAKHLSDRLELNDMPIELHDTASEFNLMLDRLELSLEKLTDFSSDLAHEIRTPINNLMMQTQVCLSKKRTIEQYQEILFSNYEEYEHLAKMISDLLFLAKAENQLSPKNIQAIDLKKEFQNLFDFYGAYASEKKMTFLLSGEATIYGEISMLRRAFGNLISNAIKYGTTNTPIRISIANTQTKIIISIQNETIPLTKAQISRLFDRFYRVDSSRQKVVEGTGLGLAITQSIIDIHHSSITAQIEKSTIIFRLEFPSNNQII